MIENNISSSQTPTNLSLNSQASNNLQVKQMGYIGALSSAKDIHDLQRRIVKQLGHWGISDFSYYHYDTVGETQLETVIKDQMRLYREGGFAEHDMFVEYFQSNAQPIYTSTVEKFLNEAPFVTETINMNKEMLNMVKSFGYEDWYLMPMKHTTQDLPALFSVSIKNKSSVDVKRIVMQRREDLKALALAIDTVALTKFKYLYNPSKGTMRPILNPKPLEVLRLLGSGRCSSLKQVSDQMNLSIVTINQHIRVVREALGVKSTYHAISSAVKMGLIEVD